MLQAHKKIGVVGVFLIVVMTIILGFTSMQKKYQRMLMFNKQHRAYKKM